MWAGTVHACQAISARQVRKGKMRLAGMDKSGSPESYNIGIYVRESRDECGEKFETIETQRDLLVDFAGRAGLGRIHGIYMDDNVSGSAFERAGLDRLKEDVEKGRINLLLLKDLSRLGRSNARTLLFLDYLEDRGVRILTFDGRYDSLDDNDTVGIETWANERYIKDISRKIRASLKYKINKGEYIGNAPFGYKKSQSARNRLCIDEDRADTVRLIYQLYRKGYGYTSIARMLEAKGCKAPGGGIMWSNIAVRRIIGNRVYTGDTIQGVSEKISFKSKKTRRLPEGEWVITENTHDAVISKEEFNEVQILKSLRKKGTAPHKGKFHLLRDLIYCGLCGSRMYARVKKNGQTFYICSKYYKYGSGACQSHIAYEKEVLDALKLKILMLIRDNNAVEGFRALAALHGLFRDENADRLMRIEQQMKQKQKQQEMLYTDRLEERITESLFMKMNRQLEERISNLKSEVEILKGNMTAVSDADSVLSEMHAGLENIELSNEMVKCIVKRITVYNHGESLADIHSGLIKPGKSWNESWNDSGIIVIDLCY